MRTHAQTVIIGAGIAGCAMACHLAALGRRDIVVVDAGPLFHTGGSTSHAPGGLSDIALSRMMFTFGRDSLDLYAELSTDDGPAAKLLGGIETAQTPERWAELKRRAGWAKSWGGETELLTPAECREAYPLIEPSKLLGGLFVHRNGVGWPVRAAQAMAARAGDAA
ncbi:MAG: FAD-binding oxidoreductase, partial [Alphaproteobacteria bacterium]|nr:FAD-binding oxidoreductase [Alphaproteobacteria bacterium]